MKSRIRARRRDGFTLIETIVTVGLIAVIAAFVIPTVVQKAGAGDPVKVQNDLNTVRSAIETFAADLKNGFPHQISSLTQKPTAGVDRFIDSTTLVANQISVWNGPYLGATLSSAAGDSLATGYTAYIMNFLERYDAIQNAPEHLPNGTLNPSFAASNTLFAAVRIHGLSPVQAKALNTLFDGTTDANQASGANTTGRFRFDAPAGGLVVAYFLASPIT